MASATTIRYLQVQPSLFSPKLLPNHHRRHLHCPIRAFGRSDFDSFVRRVASGEFLKDAWRSANDGIELLAYEAKRAADRVERKYSVSQRFNSLSRAASAKAREIDQEFGIARRWRTFSSDFSRNWPRYKKELTGILESPLGRGLVMIFFLWFALSGWLFRIFILATWILPFAAPLLIGTIANNFAIEGTCPACRKKFVGYKNQVIRCTGCRNIVWQPGSNDFSQGYGRASNTSSSPDIIDIEIEEK